MRMLYTLITYLVGSRLSLILLMRLILHYLLVMFYVLQ